MGVAFIIGVGAGLGAVGFSLAIDLIRELFEQLPTLTTRFWNVAAPGIILAPVLGGLLVGPVIYRWAREAKGHGVPEVMAAILTRGGYIRPRVVVVKAFASAVTIGSGGSVGREGPIVQIGSSIGSTAGFLLNVSPRMMRTFVACGAAGGIAATFNAPIAGTLFAVEVILGDFGFIQLAPIVTSSVIATVISRGVHGNFASFSVPPYELVNPVELLLYVGLGLLCGVAAVFFIRSEDVLDAFVEKHVPLHPALQPALGGLIIGCIGLAFPQIFGVGYETIDLALHGKIPLLMLLVLAVMKAFATSITLAFGGSGGVFAPSLFMGAMWGGAVGRLASVLPSGMVASSGAYALVGMAAMVGAATQAPITAIVIIFELTNDYKIILPLMISTIVAVLAANALYSESIYTQKLRRKGIDFQQGIQGNLLKNVVVRTIMHTRYDAAPQGLPFNFLVDLLLESPRSHLPVVDDGGKMVGVVSRELARRFSREKHLLTDVLVARDVVKSAFPYLLPDDSLAEATLRFNEHQARELYVVEDAETMRLIGMVKKGDLMDAYHKEMIKVQSGESFAYNINNPHRVEMVSVMDGYGILEVESPHHFTGKELKELDLRNQYGLNILAIKRKNSALGTHQVWVPESLDRLEDGDVLVLMAKTEILNKLETLW